MNKNIENETTLDVALTKIHKVDKKLLDKSPDLSLRFPIKYDSNTTFWFKKGAKLEFIEERLEKYRHRIVVR